MNNPPSKVLASPVEAIEAPVAAADGPGEPDQSGNEVSHAQVALLAQLDAALAEGYPQAQNIAETLVDDTIRQLKVANEYLLLGADSNLQNTWEEICVELQSARTIVWDTHVGSLHSMLMPAVDALDPDQQRLLWLATEAGQDWKADSDDPAIGDLEDDTVESGAGEDLFPPINLDDIVDFLTDQVLAEAEDFDNENIRRYLEERIFD